MSRRFIGALAFSLSPGYRFKDNQKSDQFPQPMPNGCAGLIGSPPDPPLSLLIAQEAGYEGADIHVNPEDANP